MSQLVGNPISIIQQKLQLLRLEREANNADIESLEQEKKGIQNTIPKVLHELSIIRDNINDKNHEIKIYDKAISEIESNYGHVIFTSEIFKHSGDQ